MHGFDALGGLDGERGDGRHAVAVVGRKCFQIRSSTRSARGIKSGYGQKDWWCVVRVFAQLSTPSAQGSADNDAGAAFTARHAGK